jgi:hypothetical protein
MKIPYSTCQQGMSSTGEESTLAISLSLALCFFSKQAEDRAPIRINLDPLSMDSLSTTCHTEKKWGNFSLPATSKAACVKLQNEQVNNTYYT